MPRHLRLISHNLCPFVQRAAIVAAEKKIAYDRIDIDLAAKPDWFGAISPTGKVPLLEVTDADGHVHILFESAVIAEYLDELGTERLLPAEPLARARERAWIEVASALIGDIGRLYSAAGRSDFDEATNAIESRLESLEQQFAGPWFGGDRFGLVDAAFGPALRYLDVFEEHAGVRLRDGFPRIAAWSQALAQRPSVSGAVSPDYPARLIAFVRARNGYLARLIVDRVLEAI